MTALTTTKPEKDLIPIGDLGKWARDLAIVGGVSSMAAPLGMAPSLAGTAYPWVAGAAGAVTGLMIGTLLPRLLRGPLKKVPIPLLLVGGMGLGAFWGASVGAIAGLTMNEWYFTFSLVFGAAAGALQLGWFWLPYTRRMVLEKRTWPILTAAIIASPFLAYAGGWLLNFLGKIFG